MTKARTPEHTRWLACELHTHTLHSDGKHTLEEMARSAASLELDWIALTDHNTTSGLIGKEAVERVTGVRIANGLEWTTFYGHMLVLGLPTGGYADWRMLGPSDLAKGLREVKALGALAGIAHPYRVGSPMCTGCFWEYTIEEWNAIDFIEVWSGTLPSVRNSNRRAFDLWTEALNQGYRVAATCGRDWHVVVPAAEEPLPVAVTYVGERDGGPAAAIAAGEVTVSMGPLLAASVVCGIGLPGAEEAVVGIGGTVKREQRGEEALVRISLDFERRRSVWSLPEQTLEIRVTANTGVVASVSLPAGENNLIVPLETAGLTWLRAELYGTLQGCRTLIAFTNAIYFES